MCSSYGLISSTNCVPVSDKINKNKNNNNNLLSRGKHPIYSRTQYVLSPIIIKPSYNTSYFKDNKLNA